MRVFSADLEEFQRKILTNEIFRDLEANQTAVHGSRRDRLDRLPLSRSARWRTEGRAQRHVSARAQHEGGREGAPLPLGPSSTIARNVMTEPPLCQLSPASRAHFGRVAEHGFTGWPCNGLVLRFRPPVLVGSLSSTVGRPPDVPLPQPPMQKNLQDYPKSRAKSAFILLRH